MLFCMLNALALLLGWITLVVMTLKVVLGPAAVEDLHARLLAWTIDRLKTKEKRLKRVKDALFAEMKEMKSTNPALKNGALDILEIGVGSGMNLRYYPSGSRLTSLDPNPFFRQYFSASCAADAAHLHPDVRFVVGCGERMNEIADSSQDAVVVTLVLCSVQDVQQVVSEVHRVLRPGGKFFYLEHVALPAGTMKRRLQNALTHSGIWPYVLGCWLNRHPGSVIDAAGFSDVQQREHCLVEKMCVCNPMNLVNLCLAGVATK